MCYDKTRKYQETGNKETVYAFPREFLTMKHKFRGSITMAKDKGRIQTKVIGF